MTSIKAMALIALVAGALSAPAATAQLIAAKAPLYDRLGGLKGITMVVDDFIDRLVVNDTLNRNPAINAGRHSSPPPYLKFQVAQMVCQATEKEWDAMAGEFQRSLDKFKVPAAEQKELFAIVGTTMPDIVTRK